RGIARREITQESLTSGLATIVVILGADKYLDRRIDEIGKVGTRHMVIEPANGVERHCRVQVRVPAEKDIAFAVGHHKHSLYPAHGTAHEADAHGVDFRALAEQTVSGGDIGQHVAETLGATGRPTGKAAAAPLIDLERRDARTIESCRII